MGVAFVEGLQKKGLKNGVAACTKHFLGYGGGSSLSWKEIYEEVLLPHEAMIRQAGCKVLMTSYGRFRSEQAVSSDTLLNKILRGYLGFDGVVVSDYGAVGYASQKGNPDILKQRAVEALTAGNDIELPSNNSYYLQTGSVMQQEIWIWIAPNIVKLLMTWHVNPLSC